MNDKALRFEKIQIGRVPGVDRNLGFTIEGLSPGINIIHGPNGSGKSTTGRVIHELFWPGRTGIERATAGGVYRLNGATWQVDLDAGFATWRSDGHPVDPPRFGPPEVRHRYRLALDELVKAQEDDAAFAKAVAEATQGGFDLEAAAETLGFRHVPPTRSRYLKELIACRGHVESARRRQMAIETKARTLATFQQEKQNAATATENLELLQRALEYRQALHRCAKIRIELDPLPENIGLLTGLEQTETDRLKSKMDELEQLRAHQQQQIEHARAAQQSCQLPDGGILAATVRDLRARCQRLSQYEEEITRLRRQSESADAQAASARKRIGAHLTNAQLASLNRVELPEFTELSRQADRVRAERRVLEEKQVWLAPQDQASDQQECDSETVQRGLIILGQWLATPVPAQEREAHWSWPLLAAAGLATALALVLTARHHFLWFVAALIGPILAYLGRPYAAANEPDLRHGYRSSYEQTGLAAPTTWEPTAVATKASHLARLLSQRTLAEQRAARLADLKGEQARVDQRAQALADERESIKRLLGTDLDIRDEWLPVLIGTIRTWQQRLDEVAGTNRPLESAQTELDGEMAKLNADLSGFGYSRVEHADSAMQHVADLSDRKRRFDEAARDIQQTERILTESTEAQLENTRKAYEHLFMQLDLQSGDEAMLANWSDQRQKYRDLHNELKKAEGVADNAAQALADRPELLRQTRAQIEQAIVTNQNLANRRDDLARQIAEINSDIGQAKRGCDLTDALRQQQTCIETLDDARQDDCRAVVGAILTDFVRHTSADRARPEVFKRASHLLMRITNGRYRLDLDDHAPPAFLAFDETEQRTKQLNELSVGERVQLLLAVRLGFLEQEEQDARLPLLMDETLGTTDDRRAAAIIDAILEIAQQGRQVFYFTAQPDEVGKWLARISTADVPFQTVDLQLVRNQAGAQRSPLRLSPVKTLAVPAPNGLSHDDYGRRLGVPGLDPRCTALGTLHLWHLMENPERLYQLLCLGITQWGPLRALFGKIDKSDLPINPEEYARAESRASAIETAFSAWRVGRGRPVDRSVLLDCGSVSTSFINDMSALAARHDGNAEQIVAALDQGAISRWRSNKTNELRNYLEQRGFLDTQKPMTPDEIRIDVFAAVAKDLQSDMITQQWLDRMLVSLP